jgi:GTP cyclohydrolase I
LDHVSLTETPARVTDAFADELLSGYALDLPSLILEGSEEISSPHDPVLIDNIAVSTVCPHHMLVAQGKALVAYVPGPRILGLGAVARVVDACSRRLVFQEQIAGAVADALMNHLGAVGAFCRIQLSHACMGARGAHQADATVTTWAGRGALQDPSLLETVLGRFLVEPAPNGSESKVDEDEEEEVSRVHNLPPEEDPEPA